MASREYGLSWREEKFIVEYLVDFNATAAVKRCNFPTRYPDRYGASLLNRPAIKERVEGIVASRGFKVSITLERVLEELARIAFFDARNLYVVEDHVDSEGKPYKRSRLKQPHELDDQTAGAVQGYVQQQFGTKVYTHSKTEALTLLAKYLGMLRDAPGLQVNNALTINRVDYGSANHPARATDGRTIEAVDILPDRSEGSQQPRLQDRTKGLRRAGRAVPRTVGADDQREHQARA